MRSAFDAWRARTVRRSLAMEKRVKYGPFDRVQCSCADKKLLVEVLHALHEASSRLREVRVRAVENWINASRYRLEAPFKCPHAMFFSANNFEGVVCCDARAFGKHSSAICGD